MQLSYFTQLVDAATFAKQASGDAALNERKRWSPCKMGLSGCIASRKICLYSQFKFLHLQRMVVMSGPSRPALSPHETLELDVYCNKRGRW
ncbi:MAG TPA: hypothetical protein VEL31_27910 [Ktedonobacteraceae bacterium]|nr:hypothetical protein [Ktedonobacteraceae bacterium]